jgi:hypothetical protein
MKKLSLKLEELTVETFGTDAVSERRGTVQGHYGTLHTDPDNPDTNCCMAHKPLSEAATACGPACS